MNSEIGFKNLKRKDETRYILGFSLLLLLFLLSLYLNLTIGSVSLSFQKLVGYFLGSDSLNTMESNILFKIRLPRALGAILFGAALSISGYLLQVFFRNPIAGPYVLGISSGAKLLVGVLILTNTSIGLSVHSLWALFFASTIGSLLVMLVVLLISSRVKSISALLVVGIMIGYIASAFTNLLIAFANENKIAGITTWSLGSFSGMNMDMIKVSTLVIIPCIILVFLISRALGIYQFGENYAKSMGVNIKVFRVILIGLSSVLCAVVTAFAGPISFVGIAVPHLTRLLFKKNNPRVLVLGLIFTGSIFCLLCDLIARTLFSPIELNLSTVTSFIGAPAVIYLMMRRKKD